MIYRIEDINTDWLYENGIQRGVSVGFECLEEIFSIKKRSTVYFMGAPFSGKSEFCFEVLINLSRFYGWKHCLFSPETGEPKEIMAELAAKYIGKDYTATYNNQMSLAEKAQAERFLNEHFVIIAPDNELNPYEFYDAVDKCEKDCNIKFDTVVIDPWNELKHEKGSNRDDEYLDVVLRHLRVNAVQHNRVNIITTHCRDQQPMKQNGMIYYPPPTPRDYAGGQVWFRKGMSMVAIWRPAPGVCDQNGVPYEDNAVEVIIQKAKPKGVAEPGKTNRKARLFYDHKTHRYYEQSGTGTRYAGKLRDEIIEAEPPKMVL